MAYSTTFLRKLKFPLSFFNKGRTQNNILNIPPGTGVGDIPLWNITLDIVAANKFEQRFTATATQTAFTIAKSLPAPTGNVMPVMVFRNGSKLKWVVSGPTAGQFTYSGTTITVSSSTVNDIIEVVY